jgi:hypothetical protein
MSDKDYSQYRSIYVYGSDSDYSLDSIMDG